MLDVNRHVDAAAVAAVTSDPYIANGLQKVNGLSSVLVDRCIPQVIECFLDEVYP